MSPAVDAVIVAIPARNEEALLGACLRSVRVAGEALRTARPGIRVAVVVALDRCTDASAEVAAGHPVVAVPTVSWCVGSARDVAVDAGLTVIRAGGGTEETTWIACTDADTSVPADWLLVQTELAEAGVDVVVGTVEPVGEVDPFLLRRWHERHQLVEGHPHVHGANLGMRATTWASLGGFGAHAVHEDVQLVERARNAGVAVSATDRTRVHTSARRIGRVDNGFAGYLAAMTRAG